jgi:iron complex outermembrane receptor protein
MSRIGQSSIVGLDRPPRTLLSGLCALALAAVLPQVANAQADTSQTGQNSAQAVTVGQVVVTATRRSEKLRDVPSSIAVVTGATLAQAGPITNTGDILVNVPGVRFNNLAQPLLSEVSMRGSGTERATGADPAVGLFANGVYVGGGGGLGRNFSVIDSFDIERVEVLAGPQGALYGRNAEYGVVNLISAQPQFNESGYVDLVHTFQTDKNQETAVVNHQINDFLAVRLGVEGFQQQGGFVFNPDKDNYFDTTKGGLGRIQLRYRQGGWDVDLLLQSQKLQLPSFWSDDYILPGTIPTAPLGFIQSRDIIPHNGNDETLENVNQVALLANYDFGWAKLTSSSSFRERQSTLDYDLDYIDPATESALQTLGEKGSYPFAQYNLYDQSSAWYEDVHLAGASFGEHLNWLAGGEYLHEDDSTPLTQSGNPCGTSAAPNPVVGKGICYGVPSNPLCFEPTPTSTPCGPVVSPYGSNAVTYAQFQSWAIYASLAYKFGYGVTLTVDGRYTDDRKTAVEYVSSLYTGAPYPFKTGGTIPPVTNYSYSKGVPTYTATLSWKIPGSWNDLLYAKVGTGYRAGGFNFGHTAPLVANCTVGHTAGCPAGITPAVSYAPVVPNYTDETTTSYEIGIKGNLTHYAYFSLDAYTATTQNALAAVGDGCAATNACETGNTNYTINAGTAKTSGIETEIDSNLNLMGGVLGVEINGSDSFATYISEPNRIGVPIVGSQVAQNPHWQLTTSLNYKHHLFGGVDGFANLLYHGQWGGNQDPVVAGTPANHLANYEDLNLRAGVDFQRFEVALVAENLTNELHHLALYQQGAFPVQVRWSLPQTVALEAKYKW